MLRTNKTYLFAAASAALVFVNAVTALRAGVASSAIEGLVWDDRNGDGTKDPDEPGLPGVVVFLDANRNGSLDRSDPTTTTLSTREGLGGYRFSRLAAGDYVVREVVPEGFKQSFPSREEHRVTVRDEQIVRDVNFGNVATERDPGSVRGRKWLDENGNGRQDENEPGLAGVTIYVDLNNDGTFDEGEPRAVSSGDDPETQFDESGHYWLEDLRPGRHVIREIVPDGFEQTFPPARVFEAPPVEGNFASVAPGGIELVLGLDDKVAQTVSLSVLPFCVRPYEVDVIATDAPAGMVVNTTGVLMNGCGGDISSFDLEIRGNGSALGFDLEFVDAEFGGSLASIPVRIVPSAGHPVAVGSGQTVEGVDFGNREIPETGIRGTKWFDENGNGRRDENEPGLAGVTIYVDLNNNGSLDRNEPRDVSQEDDPKTQADETGHYWLEGLSPGQHVVREVVPDGFVQTFPRTETTEAEPEVGTFSTVSPGGLTLALIAGEMRAQRVSFSVSPFCVRPYEVDVIAPDAPEGMVSNTSGVILNGCGGDTSSFDLEITGDGGTSSFDLQFVDAESGDVLASIPVLVLESAGHAVSVRRGQIVDGVDFGNSEAPATIITGTKWEDRNGNGRRDDNEPGLPGVTIYADLNQNGALDRGEPSDVSRRDDPGTRFDESGLYWLEGLRPGRHVIREVVPDGFMQTFPSADVAVVSPPIEGVFATVAPGSVEFVLGDGDTATQTISMAVLPLCFRPYEVDVVAPDAPAGMVVNTTGVLMNSCGGDSSSFDIEITGDGNALSFELQFIDAEFGGVLASIPVSIRPEGGSGSHEVALGEGETVAGVDFGNTRVGERESLQRPGDCNQDSRVDLSDGICLLGHLFQGSPSVLPCGEGSRRDRGNVSLLDSNGDRNVDLSDGIYIFTYLFVGGLPPVLGSDCVEMFECPNTCGE